MKMDSLKGLGPKSIKMLNTIGITSYQQFMEKDPYDIYAKLKKEFPDLSMNMLYALIGAQEDIHWQEVASKRKTEILMRLDDMGMAPGQ